LRRRLDLEIRFARGATFHDFGGEIEVLDATGGFALLEREGHRDVGVGGLAIASRPLVSFTLVNGTGCTG
jgi:hypothetical protein